MNVVINDDCMLALKSIESESVDLVLTDPPYNISKKNNFKTMNRAGIDFGSWDVDFDLFSYIMELPRLLKKNGSVIIFNDWKNIGNIAMVCEKNGLEIKDMIRWEKSNPMPRNRDRRYITDYEVAVWCVKKGAKWTFNRQNDTYDRPKFVGGLTSSSEKTEHTTQKPTWLMRDILKVHSNHGDVVLDMFAGSGTTGVACVETGRNYILIEKEKKYYDIIVSRIKEVQDCKCDIFEGEVK